jgi:hypothetical protein
VDPNLNAFSPDGKSLYPLLDDHDLTPFHSVFETSLLETTNLDMKVFTDGALTSASPLVAPIVNGPSGM